MQTESVSDFRREKKIKSNFGKIMEKSQKIKNKCLLERNTGY